MLITTKVATILTLPIKIYSCNEKPVFFIYVTKKLDDCFSQILTLTSSEYHSCNQTHALPAQIFSLDIEIFHQNLQSQSKMEQCSASHLSQDYRDLLLFLLGSFCLHSELIH